jgi:YEATS domain-containing protein 1/3
LICFQDVQVTFEFGHRSAIRTKVTPDGYTHDWEVFVRGADGADISHFVEKVVFYLHETFPKPKRGKAFYKYLQF